ncbi:MAG: M23 family metallopeptidase [Bacteroidales bacterium]|nr:M23 family metallopeptidase [Bacteroidales bacterium]
MARLRDIGKQIFTDLKNKGGLPRLLKKKQRLVVVDTETLREKLSFELTGINLFVAVGSSLIVLVALTVVLIAFTPLREFIPGYSNAEMVEQTYKNAIVVDSLERQIANQEMLLQNIQSVLMGKDPAPAAVATAATPSAKPDSVSYTHSKADAELRREVESADNKYQVRGQGSGAAQSQQASANAAGTMATYSQLFFTPLKGKVLSSFDPAIKHYGVDIAGPTNATIKAAYSGTVLFANFTVETGYVIAIQHQGNIVSIYKHNSALLKHEGDVVRAGEPIAYLGNSGDLTSGPHLHFELWVASKPVNPLQYISF